MRTSVIDRIGAQPLRTLTALYVAVRLIGLAIGMRFDATNLTSWMQIADLALLRDHLWRTLWYLHTQPPLFNLMIGLAIRLGPAGFPWAIGLVFAIVTLGGILATHALLRDLTGRPRLALLIAAWLCVSPAVLLFSQKLYYDGLVPWLLVMALWGLHAGVARRSVGRMAFGFAMLAMAVLTRSMIHPALLVMIAALFIGFAPGQRLRLAGAAAGPFAAVALVIAKNMIVFGTMSLSSWPALNFDTTMVDRLPMAQRIAMVRRGTLSRYAVVPGFSPPSVYLPIVGPLPPTGEPSLDNLRKSTGEENWNHRLYLVIAKPRMHDALVGLAADPASFVHVLVTSVYHFHRPSSEFKGLEANRAVIAPWERIGNAVIGLQPAAWLGRTDDPRRSQAVLPQISGLAVAETIGFAGFVAMLGAGLLRDLRARRRPAPALATLGAVALLGGYVIAVSTACDVYENNRAHYDIGVVLTIGALVFASRLADRRRVIAGASAFPAAAAARTDRFAIPADR